MGVHAIGTAPDVASEHDHLVLTLKVAAAVQHIEIRLGRRAEGVLGKRLVADPLMALAVVLDWFSIVIIHGASGLRLR